jgi:rod shape determining protein RodA
MTDLLADRRGLGVVASRRRSDETWRQVDFLLLSVTAALGLLGGLMIASATYKALQADGKDPLFYFKRHIVFLVIGVTLMMVTALIDYRVFLDHAAIWYVLALGALAAVLVPSIGAYNNGARAWFAVGSFQVQPSEFTKLVLILALAAYGSAQRNLLDTRRFVTVLAIAGLPIGLIYLEPDLGTALVFLFIVLAMLWCSGARAVHLFGLLALGILSMVLAVKLGILDKYQLDRLTSFANPGKSLQGAGYQVLNSKIAIGAGGLYGAGLFSGSQTASGFVPFRHTDFIFSAVGEQLGFVGAVALLALFAILAWRIVRTATIARDTAGSLVCVGVLAMFMFQIFENVGMSMGIMPVTGIPLPFLSYGGTSTIVSFLGVGLVLNVGMHRFR